MKTLRNSLLALTMLLFVSSASFAQFPPELLNWQIGLRLGPSFVHGDLGGGMGFAVEGYLERKFADQFSLQGTMSMGSVSNGDGEELTLATGKKAYLNFQTSTFEMLLHGKYYIQRDVVSPFVSLGLGMLFYTVQTDVNKDGTYGSVSGWDGDPNSNVESSVYRDGLPIGTMSIPIGAGFNYAINDMLDVSVSYTFRFTTTDHIDGADPSSGSHAGAAYESTVTSDNFTVAEFDEITMKRQEMGDKSGNDLMSFFCVGMAYKFFNADDDSSKDDE